MSAITSHQVLPAEGITLTIGCRTGDGRPTRHAAQLGPDWAFSTPHDLDPERIGVALGGSLTCVQLADHDLPAARDLLEHRNRTRPAAIIQHGPLEWGAAAPASGCACDTQRWSTVTQAAEHVRTMSPWVAVHRTRHRGLVQAMALLDRAGVEVAEANPVGRSQTAHRRPPSAPLAGGRAHRRLDALARHAPRRLCGGGRPPPACRRRRP